MGQGSHLREVDLAIHARLLRPMFLPIRFTYSSK